MAATTTFIAKANKRPFKELLTAYTLAKTKFSVAQNVFL